MVTSPPPTAPTRTCAACRVTAHRGTVGRIAAGAMLAATFLMPSLAQATPADTGLARARQSLEEMSDADGTAPGNDWRHIHAWQRFVIVSTLSDYERLSGDTRFDTAASRALANRQGLDGNDDDLWVAQADLDMARIAHAPDRVADARRIFDMVAGRYWDTTCNGGVWWDHARTYKNAITNELFIATAVRLYQQTHEDTYRDWARRGWAWLRDSGMVNASGLVNDGLDAHCANNAGPAYSYNQGVILDALAGVAALTHDARATDMATRIALAATAAATDPHGTVHEAREPMGTDARIFRGIFVRALGHFVPTLPDGPQRATLSDWLAHESDRVWATRHPPARFSATWTAHPFQSGAQAQLTAAALFIATAQDGGHTREQAP